MISKINKILFATDLTKNSKNVMLYADDFAKKYDAEIVIIHTLPEISPTLHVLFNGIGEEERLLRKRLKEKIDFTTQKIKEDLTQLCTEELQCDINRITSIEVCEGHPEDQIIKKADELNCDAIVMGTHGKKLSSAYIGSVTRGVLRRVKKPVLVIPLPSS